MANGFCPALLDHLADIAGTNYPGRKVTMPGFTKFLYEQTNRPIVVGNGGHRRTVNVKFLQRGAPNAVSTTPGCTLDAAPTYKEVATTLSLYVKKTMFFGDDTIRQYCEDASAMKREGQPATEFMNFVLEGMFGEMNSLYSKQDELLLTKAGLNVGKHVGGTTGAVTVNIKQDASVNDLTTGLTKLLTDAENNEFCGAPAFIYGSGSLMHAYDSQLKAKALGMGDSGVDPSVLANTLGFVGYRSVHATAALGNANNMLMIGPGQVHYIENQRMVGSFAGERGTSTFGTLVDPRNQCWGNVPVKWDFQAKYIDCPEALTDEIGNGYINSNSITEDTGYAITLSKYFDLFVTPSNAYDGGDRLSGGDRPLLYTITNS